MSARPDLATARSRLLLERDLSVDRLDRLRSDLTGIVESSRDTNADDEHDPEGATIAFERSQIGALVRLVEGHLDAVDRALRQVTSGAYGVCESCRTPIAADRLEARPTAVRCIDCAR